MRRKSIGPWVGLVLVAVVAGFAAGVWLFSDDSPPPNTPTPNVSESTTAPEAHSAAAAGATPAAVGLVRPSSSDDDAGALLAAAEFSVVHGELLSMLPIARADAAEALVHPDGADAFTAAVDELAGELAVRLGVMASWELATAEAPLRVELLPTTSDDSITQRVRVWSVLVISSPEAGSHQLWRTWTLTMRRQSDRWAVATAEAEWGPSPLNGSMIAGASDHDSIVGAMDGYRPWAAELELGGGS